LRNILPVDDATNTVFLN